MNKDELLDYLASTDAELYKDLMSYDGKTEDFYKQNKQRLRELPDFPDVEDKLKAPKTPKERVKDAFDDYDGLDPYYVEQKANKLNLPLDEVNKYLGELNDERKAAEEFEQKAQLDYERQKAVDDYKHRYFGMSEDNPINKGLNKVADFIISSDTRKAIKDDPNNTGRIVGNAVADIGGTAADFLPGIGGYVVGPGIRAARDVAEDKPLDEILLNAGTDVGSNFILGKDLKRLGVNDFGPARQIEEMLPTSEWAEKANKAYSMPKKDLNKEIPDFKTRGDAIDWIEKQPREMRKEYWEVLGETRGRGKNVTEAIENKQEELKQIYNKDRGKVRDAYEWTKRHQTKAALGREIQPGIQRTIWNESQEAVKDKLNGSNEKLTNPKSIKGDYNKAIDYVIKNTKKQWEAGFVPNAVPGDITYEAYKKWMEEK
jgi:hypothetical protein